LTRFSLVASTRPHFSTELMWTTAIAPTRHTPSPLGTTVQCCPRLPSFSDHRTNIPYRYQVVCATVSRLPVFHSPSPRACLISRPHLPRRNCTTSPDSCNRHAIATWPASDPDHPTLPPRGSTPPHPRPPPAATPTKRTKILFRLEVIKAKGEQCHLHIRVPNKEQAELCPHQIPPTREVRSGSERRDRRKRHLRRKMSTRTTRSFMSSTILIRIPRRDGSKSGRVER